MPRSSGSKSRFFSRTYLPVWFALLGVLIALFYADRQQEVINVQSARAQVQNDAGIIRARLEGVINADMQLIQGLVAVLSINPDMTQQEFSAVAGHVIGDKTEIINIAVAPDLVVDMVHPYAPNAAVIGLDYNRNQAQRAAALQTRDTGEPVLAGPVELIQGGRGFIGRFPIFVDTESGKRFWGIVSAVLDTDEIYAATGLNDPDLPLDIALIGHDGQGLHGPAFFGNPDVVGQDPVEMEIALPAGRWHMAAIPRGGWPSGSDSPWPLKAMLLAAGVLIVIPTFATCHLSAIRRQVIDKLARQEKNLAAHQMELQRLSAVAQHASDSIVLTDNEARIIWVNHAFTKMTGYTLEEAVGKIPGDLLNGPQTSMETNEEINAHRDNGAPYRGEICNVNKAGEEIWVDIRLVPVKDENGAVTMTIGIERDITEKKQHELELARAKIAAETADRAKSDFLANMSHEIRTPMNGIIGMADLLAEGDLDDEEQQCVETIQSSSKALLKIINDILDLSRLEAGKLTVEDSDFNLRHCVDAVLRVLRPVAMEKALSLKIDYAANLPETVRADDGRLRQILLNLLGNAVKFTEEGKVSLRVWHADGDPYHLFFEVTDTGIGLNEAQAKHIFDRFSQADAAITRSYGGTGLGLTISSLLAEQMGGSISLASEPGKGSQFTLDIHVRPAEARPAPQGDSPEEVDTAAIHGMRVLIAEDNRTNRLLIRKYLSGLSVEIIEAENGLRAVDLFREHRPDLILMDMSMPEMDGLQAARTIRALPRPQVPIVALTANAYASDREACLAAGMDDFLAKPVNKEALLRTLIAALQKAAVTRRAG
ncbi:response regulator [Celeribacter neptunius]|uniref:histidine kinase n=1 Tax=Celeribacter neptunius TaxID=588602 RepID=A0A1I3JP67_9RHOB|nr:response regulator [Celeribacter neptunius]SFI61954.1 multi-sensor hybrid histidine kinase [Celeribacter neptunius]